MHLSSFVAKVACLLGLSATVSAKKRHTTNNNHNLGSIPVGYFEVKDNRIIDEYGRERYFHGMNVVYKSDPYLPITDHFDADLSFSEEDMQLFQSLGLNVIRLGVMWPGVAIERGVYNMTYIAAARDLIETAFNDYGIYSLVDCHQDVLSECFCGEGAPNWAMEPTQWNFPFPIAKAYDSANSNSEHIPSQDDCLSHSWANYYNAAAVGSAFQAIYSNQNGLADEFANYWGLLAHELKGVPGVLGLELFNEPWAGDTDKDPLLLIPGEADRKNLQPFYDHIVPQIYGNDSNRLVFFESVTWTDNLNISATDSGFTHVPGGSEYASTSVYSFHYYAYPAGLNFGSVDKYFSARTDDSKRWGSATFLTEFNTSNDDEDMNSFETQSTIMDYADQYLTSWTGWEYKPYAGALSDGTCTGCGYGLFLPNGTLNVDMAKMVARVYPQAVAGTVTSFSFDWKTGTGQISYNINGDINEPTIVFANNKYWCDVNGQSYQVSLESNVDLTVKEETAGYFHITNDGGSASNGESVKVTVKCG